MAAKSLMVLGTMSSAGKSFVTAGLCRIFRQDGYRTAPFKSQNMALNSYITADGMEMGRAQVMQAEAAGIAPDVRMNPILLKPTSDMRLAGDRQRRSATATMRAQEYYTTKAGTDSLHSESLSRCWQRKTTSSYWRVPAVRRRSI